MTLPGIEIAVIEERKVLAYLLAADHPEGASKAVDWSPPTQWMYE